MGKKIGSLQLLLSMHPRNFGSNKIVRTPFVRPLLHVSQGEFSHFKHPRASFRGKSHSHPDF